MKAAFLCLALIPLGLSGCTVMALNRAMVVHGGSSMDLRYREVMENLAMVYQNPHALPAFTTIYSGATDVNDSIKLTSASTWTRTALKPVGYLSIFATQSIDLFGSRSIKNNWTLDPTIVPEKLRAMRAACNWALRGPASAGADLQLLTSYQPAQYNPQFPGDETQIIPASPPGYYFSVESKMPDYGWLHCGSSRAEISKHACFWAGSGCHFVWVESQGLEGLSQFLLVMQAIARTDFGSTYFPRPATRTITREIETDDDQNQYVATFYVDADGFLTPGDGIPVVPAKVRFDNVGSYSDLKSVINALGQVSLRDTIRCLLYVNSQS